MRAYKISIIIPVYNGEQYLSQAFNSLLRQTIGFDNLQIIFVDDCSTDKSLEIINSYASKHPNVVSLCLAKNSGFGGKPGNLAMKHAVADYYMFLDADDWFADNACEVLYEKIVHSNTDIVSGYHSIVDYSGKILTDKMPQYQNKADIRLSLPGELVEAFKLRSHWCNKIYKKSIIEDNKIIFHVDNFGEDLIFFTQYLLLCKSYQYIDLLIYFYRLRTKDDLSLTNNRTAKYFLVGNKYFKQIASLVIKNNHEELFRILISEIFHISILELIDSQKLSESEIKTILRSYRWMFIYTKEKKLFENIHYMVSLSEAIIANNFTQALSIILAIRPFRIELFRTMEGKAWLEEQLENHKKALENLKVWTEQRESIINEQQDLIKKQQEAIDRYSFRYWVKIVLKKFN